jgi:putative transposase
VAQADGPGRRPVDPALYKERNSIERGLGRFKQWRGLATRYGKQARTYARGVLLAVTIMLGKP